MKSAGFVRPMSEWEPYTQEEPGIAAFRWVLKENEVGGLAMGHVTLTGPIHKTPAAHEWEQVYLLMEGNGVMHLGDKVTPVTAPAVIVIPRGTQHSMQVPAGSTLKYVFINQYR